MIFMPFIHHFYKKGGDDNNGDFQKDIRDTMPQINKQVFFIIIIIIIIRDTKPKINKQVFFIIIILCGLLMVNKHVFDREKTVARITSSKQNKKNNIGIIIMIPKTFI